MELSLPFLCISAFIALVSFIFLMKVIKHSKLNLPPGPRKLPIIGNLHQLGASELPHRSLYELSKKHGPVMLLHFGFAPVVIISSSAGAEDVLKTHDSECCNRPDVLAGRKLSRNFRDIAFTPFGHEWKERRKLAAREALGQKKVESFRYVREEECNLLVKQLSESASKQSPVDMSKHLFSLTASIILKVVFGQNFHESKFIDKDRMEELLFEAEVASASFSFSDFYPWGGFGWIMDWISGLHKRLDNVLDEVDDFLQKVIDDHLTTQESDHDQVQDIIHVMLNMIQKKDKDDFLSWLSIDHIKAILANVFVAGIDTAAITMIWAMTELVRNPNQMKKVQDEIRSCLGPEKKSILEEDIEKVHYLKLVIKETFRLHPPAPLLLPRETMADIKIQGYDIPAKTRIQINAWAIGQDPEHWTSPEEFIPERFLGSRVDYKGQQFELLPFGSGRRICPGISLGISMVELGLLNLLYFFDWKFPEGMTEKDIDVEEAGALTVLKKVPLRLVPVLRH